MRKKIAALVAVVALAATSACGPKGPEPTPSASALPSAAASPTSRLMSRDTYRGEFDKAAAAAKSTLGFKAALSIKTIPAGRQVNCDIYVADNATTSVTYCEKERYIPVSTALLDRLVTEQATPAVVWYLVSRALALIMKRYSTPEQFLCAAGFVAAKWPGFTDSDETMLQNYILAFPDLGMDASSQAAVARSGVTFAQHGGAVSACA